MGKNNKLIINDISFFDAFPWVWLVVAYGITFAVLALYGRPYIDSDMSSEMILADLLNKEGGLMTINWWYSTEIKFCSLQVFYQIGLKVFPQNWYAARILGQALLTAVLLIAFLYVGHGLKLKGNGIWGAAALACPFGMWYFWYGAFGGYYLAYMIYVLLSFGAILHLLQPANKIRRLFRWALLVGSALISGLNSVKGLMVFYLPMFVASILYFVLRFNEKRQEGAKREEILLVLSLISLAVASIGYLLNSMVLSTSHHFQNFNVQRWSEFNINRLVYSWSLFLSLFGYPGDAAFNNKIPLFSLMGILGALGILTIAAIVVSIIRLLGRWKKMQDLQSFVPILFASICVIQGLVFSCTGTSGASPQSMNASYWLPAIPFVFLMLQLEGETENIRLPILRKGIAIAFCVCIVATSISSVMQFFKDGYRINPDLEPVCDWLTEQGYTQGYATFWNGNVMTEWSSGQLDMWVVGDFNIMEPDQWLQKTSHEQKPEGQIFLLTSRWELERMGLSSLYWWSTVVYEEGERSGDYLVMVYKDYDDMMNAIHGAQSWEQEAAQETQDTQSA